mmetsp:Transcript_9631/g.18329  ORF Transcript_9631/g.18329 Transcript_9631/m.18329 type:complete len:339 (-) Transcript_9631:224-1240(-)
MSDDKHDVSKWDVYGILGVPSHATKAEIKKAFRKLALKLHPDKCPGDKTAAAKFDKLEKSYKWIIDDDNRKAFDLKKQAEIVRKRKLEAQDAGRKDLRRALERREADAQAAKHYANQKTKAEKTEYQNKQFLEEMVKQGVIGSKHVSNSNSNFTAKPTVRSSSNAPPPASASSAASPDRSTTLLVKWKKGSGLDELTSESLKQQLSAFGDIALVIVKAKKRKAHVVFDKNSSVLAAVAAAGDFPELGFKALNSSKEHAEDGTGGDGSKRPKVDSAPISSTPPTLSTTPFPTSSTTSPFPSSFNFGFSSNDASNGGSADADYEMQTLLRMARAQQAKTS